MNDHYPKNESGDNANQTLGDSADPTSLPHAGLLGADGKPIPETNEAETSKSANTKIADAQAKISKWVVIWAAVTAVATICQAGIAWYSKTQTDQFNQMKSVADRMEGAANTFAGNSANINQSITVATAKLQAQADAMDTARKTSETNSKLALDASINQMRLDQRAWLGIGDAVITLNTTDPARVTISIRNVGKTPAEDITGIVGLAEKPKNVPFLIGDIKYGGDTSESGTLYPGSTSVIGKNLETVWPGQETDVKSWKSGERVVYIFASITYHDVFKKRHWAHFCGVVQKDLTTIRTCNHIYNDSDEDNAYKSKQR